MKKNRGDLFINFIWHLINLFLDTGRFLKNKFNVLMPSVWHTITLTTIINDDVIKRKYGEGVEYKHSCKHSWENVVSLISLKDGFVLNRRSKEKKDAHPLLFFEPLTFFRRNSASIFRDGKEEEYSYSFLKSL